MAIQESGEMYLETILILTKKQPNVRAIDISDYMGYSKPSVSRAMGLLKREGLIIVDDSGYISLTKAGKELSTKIYERHNVLTTLLVDLGVSEKTALLDACKLEHVISDETFFKIKQFIEKK